MEKLWFKTRFLLVLNALCFLNYGCSLMHPDSLARDNQGYFKKHYYSCGPQALAKAITEIDSYKAVTQVSKDIQETGNGFRFILSLFHHEAISITFPSEVKDVCEQYGYEVIEINDFDGLDPEKDVAIVLVWGKVLKHEAHWLCFPVDKDIKSFFGEGTTISKIFIIKKKNGG